MLAPQDGTITVVLRAEPRGKGRPRHRIITPRPGTTSWAKGKRKPFTISYTDDETEEYEKALAWAAKAAMRSRAPLAVPLSVTITAIMPIPKSWPARKRDAALAGTICHTSTPDCDNLAKTIDALNDIVWVDDKQIVQLSVSKQYGEEPLFEVKVRPVAPVMFGDTGLDRLAVAEIPR